MIKIEFKPMTLIQVPEHLKFSDVNLCQDSSSGEISFEIEPLISVLEYSNIPPQVLEESGQAALVLVEWYRLARANGEPENALAEEFLQIAEQAESDHYEDFVNDPLESKYFEHRKFPIPPALDYKEIQTGYAIAEVHNGVITDIIYLHKLMPDFDVGFDPNVDPEEDWQANIDSWFDISVIHRALRDERVRTIMTRNYGPDGISIGAVTGLTFVEIINSQEASDF